MSIEHTHRKTIRESKRVTTPQPRPSKKKRKQKKEKTNHEESSNGRNEGQTIGNTKNK